MPPPERRWTGWRLAGLIAGVAVVVAIGAAVLAPSTTGGLVHAIAKRFHTFSSAASGRSDPASSLPAADSDGTPGDVSKASWTWNTLRESGQVAISLQAPGPAGAPLDLQASAIYLFSKPRPDFVDVRINDTPMPASERMIPIGDAMGEVMDEILGIDWSTIASGTVTRRPLHVFPETHPSASLLDVARTYQVRRVNTVTHAGDDTVIVRLEEVGGQRRIDAQANRRGILQVGADIPAPVTFDHPLRPTTRPIGGLRGGIGAMR